MPQKIHASIYSNVGGKNADVKELAFSAHYVRIKKANEHV
jgi:hypothetical protein